MPDTDTLTTRDITVRTICVRAESIDKNDRSVEAVLSTENPTRVFDWGRYKEIDEVLIARGAEMPSQMPMLESHRRYSLDNVLGSIRQMKVENVGGESVVVGRLFFATGDDVADRAWKKVEQGHLTDISVGYRALKYVEIKPNTTQRINGREFTAGDVTLRITTKWKLREASLVPIGADEAAKIREEFQGGGVPQSMENRKMPDNVVIDKLTAKADADTPLADAMDTNDAQAKALDRQRSAAPTEPVDRFENSTTLTAPGMDAVRREGAVAERERIHRLRELGGSDVPAELVTRAIDEGMTVDQASKLYLEAIRSGRPDALNRGPAIITHDHERDCTLDALVAGLQMRCGDELVAPEATDSVRKQQARLAEMGERYADMHLLDVCREAIRMDGNRIPHSRDDVIRAAVSGGTLTKIFGDTVNARLQREFAAIRDTTAGWTRELTVSDFKINEEWRLTKQDGMNEVPEGGTADDATVEDTGETFKVSRYGKKFTIDEIAIINDSHRALAEVPGQMAEAAARLRPNLVYSILLGNPSMADGTALFHANHGNLNTGAALAVATLDAALQTMHKQTENGVILDVMPSYLIIPPALEFLALQLLRSVELRDTTSSTQYGTWNPLQAKGLKAVIDPRLELGVTDPKTKVVYSGSATTWRLGADGAMRSIAVAHLRNRKTPRVRSFALTAGQWGIQHDIQHVVGAAPLNVEGIQQNTA